MSPVRRARRATRLALPMVAALVVVACSGTASTPPATSTPGQPTDTPSAATSAPAATGTSASPSGPAGSPGALPAPEVTQVKAGTVPDTTAHDAEVAVEDGLFAKNGLTVTTQMFTTDGDMVTALLAGQVDMIFTAGVAGPIGSLATNSPLVVVMMSHDNIPDNLYTAKNVKTAADLKGKSIAISSFASDTYGEALVMLAQLGLSPSDVTITPIGDDAARRAALVAGSVAGSLNDRAEKPAMAALGFNVLLASQDITGKLPVSAVVTTRAYAQKNPNTVLAVVASLLQGLHTFLTNPADAAQAAVKFEKIDLATATADVQADLPGWTPQNGRPTLAEFQLAQSFFSKTDPALAKVDVSQAFTTQFVDQLQSLGWYQANGIAP